MSVTFANSVANKSVPVGLCTSVRSMFHCVEKQRILSKIVWPTHSEIYLELASDPIRLSPLLIPVVIYRDHSYI